ncbi:GCN5 family acetyltransferase [Ralstonia sp. 22111]|uniref:GCN5 family acetyltransferase n=2 Tax=Ralstonia sp. 22111 TaxID=3453878 RepID=UPI003F8258E5
MQSTIKLRETSIVNFPPVLNLSKVGEYPAGAKAGGGFVWDAVLEYRVWCHPERGAPDEADGSDYYYAFGSYEDAEAFFRTSVGAEEPLALVLQREYIDEPEPGKYVHVREERITEWPVAFLRRPKRDPHTIPAFLAEDAPANRLDIIRGLAPRSGRTG